MIDWISFLVTGPETNLMNFKHEAMFLVEFFDRRKQREWRLLRFAVERARESI